MQLTGGWTELDLRLKFCSNVWFTSLLFSTFHCQCFCNTARDTIHEDSLFPGHHEDPKSRALESALHCSYGVNDGTLRWIYFLDSRRALGGPLPVIEK